MNNLDYSPLENWNLSDKEKVLAIFPDAKSKREIREIKKTYVSPYPFKKVEGFKITAGPFEVWDQQARRGWSFLVSKIRSDSQEKKRQEKVKRMLREYKTFKDEFYFSDVSIFEITNDQKNELKFMIYKYLQENVNLNFKQ